MPTSELSAEEVALLRWIHDELSAGNSRKTVVGKLIDAGFPVGDADAIVDTVAEARERRTSHGLNPVAVLVAIGLLLWFSYNSIVAFDAGYDNCRWGEPSETQCGFSVYGTSKGRLFGAVMYGPGYALGKALSPND